MKKTKLLMPVFMAKEKVGRKEFFVARCPIGNIASQGRTFEEAKQNITEALELYLEDEDAEKPVMTMDVSISTVYPEIPLGVLKNVKVARTVR